jgi:hypothetical protein
LEILHPFRKEPCSSALYTMGRRALQRARAGTITAYFDAPLGFESQRLELATGSGKLTNLDLILELNLPILVVVGSKLGAVNHALLTLN